MTAKDPTAEAATQASIRLLPGSVAPRYDAAHAVILQEVVITEQGTKAGLPLVDFKLIDGEGRMCVLTLTGRIVNGISTAIKGVNMRNHGTPEP